MLTEAGDEDSGQLENDDGSKGRSVSKAHGKFAWKDIISQKLKPSDRMKSNP
jgi:hypothetical protein